MVGGYIVFLVVAGYGVIKACAYCRNKKKEREQEKSEGKTSVSSNQEEFEQIPKRASTTTQYYIEYDVSPRNSPVKQELPVPICIETTKSTRAEEEGVEASLSSSSNEENRYDVERGQRVLKTANTHNTQSSDDTRPSSSRHHDYPGPGKAIDVHRCSSNLCEQCRAQRKETNFIAVEQQLESTMIGKLRTQPPKWWEFGSFVDLYNHANNDQRSETTSIWEMISWKKRAKRRLKRHLKVSSDGDELYHI